MSEGAGVDVLRVGDWRALGRGEGDAVLRFAELPKPEGSWAGHRALLLDQRPAFELSYWCGSCPFLFQREDGANRTLSLEEMRDRLAGGLVDLDDEVIAAFGDLLAEDRYRPMLLRVRPVLVEPSDDGDYFSHEQVATWGRNAFSGLPEHPRTPYYRTFATAVSPAAHLYEFVVPMVPPSWNDEDRVAWYVDRMRVGDEPTALALTSLDVCAPATGSPVDYHEHWGLTHFLLDGHHKTAAAARAGVPLTLLSLVARAGSLADDAALARLVDLRRQAPATRPERS